MSECKVTVDPPAVAALLSVSGVRWLGMDAGSEGFGIFCGCLLAIAAATSFAFARAGILAGMLAADLTLLRFVVSGLLLFPVLLRHGVLSLAGIGWKRGLALLVTGGPLAHGGVIAPATVTVASTIMATAFLGERLSRAHVIGASLVLAGIIVIGWHGLYATPGSQTLIGDLLFIGSSLLWACFSVLLRLWRLNAVRAVAVVSVLSALIMVPGYLVWVGLPHLLALPLGSIALQGLIQGVLQGVVGIVGYSHAIRVLGVSRGVLFPATVPAVSILIGMPILGEIPSLEQVAGVLLATMGMLYAVGVFHRRWF
jgi:drug/metabolite transporter (DMT)-like permease